MSRMSEADHLEIWTRLEDGETLTVIAEALDRVP